MPRPLTAKNKGWFPQPLVSQVDGGGKTVPHGIINGLLYFRLQGGVNAIIIDPEKGDIGIAVFCDRDISAVKETKGSAPAGSNRRHDMADGFYIGGGLNAAPLRYVHVSGSGITIHAPDAVTVEAPTVTVNASASATVTAPLTTINGNTVINGNLDVSGTMKNAGTSVGKTIRTAACSQAPGHRGRRFEVSREIAPGGARKAPPSRPESQARSGGGWPEILSRCDAQSGNPGLPSPDHWEGKLPEWCRQPDLFGNGLKITVKPNGMANGH